MEIDTLKVTKDKHDNEGDPLTQDLAQKMKIAKRVVLHCHNTKDVKNRLISTSNRTIISFTGVIKRTISKAHEALKISKTFTDWCQGKDKTNAETQVLMFHNIRNVIFQMYTESHKVVTKEKLKRILDGRFLKATDGDKGDMVKRDLLCHGFTWKRLPGTRKSIVVEQPEHSRLMMEYLSKITAYREAGRSIVYVDASFNYFRLIVSPQHGLLNMGIHWIKRGDIQPLKAWAQHTLSTALPPKSVIVIKEAPLYNQKAPTPYTSKSDMISWLVEREVPHHHSLHKADLYALIKKFKAPIKSYEIVYGFLKNHGHDVVYRPKDLGIPDYVEMMWLESSAQIKTDTIDYLKKKTLEDWQRYEQILASKEKQLYKDGVFLEIVTDKVLTLAKYGELTPTDLAECDEEFVDNEYYDNIIID